MLCVRKQTLPASPLETWVNLGSIIPGEFVHLAAPPSMGRELLEGGSTAFNGTRNSELAEVWQYPLVELAGDPGTASLHSDGLVEGCTAEGSSNPRS